MDWVSELRQKFRQLPTQAGAVTPVSFGDRDDTVGELGREFNTLAAELSRITPRELTREQAHGLRNRLAGILAALHVLEAEGTLSPDQRRQLREVVEEARRMDAALSTPRP